VLDEIERWEEERVVEGPATSRRRVASLRPLAFGNQQLVEEDQRCM
jgi:hypothetical protein